MPGKRRPGRLLPGHLGASVSALVDGQLDEESTERAWAHVAVCPPCLRLVEHESGLKRRLAMFAQAPGADEPTDRLLGSLRDLDPAAVAWSETEDLEHESRSRRRVGIALVGAGSVSAAVLGLTALSGASLGSGGSPAPLTSIGGSGSSAVPTRAVVTPPGTVHGRLRGWTLGSGDDGVVRARPVDAGR